MRLLKRGERHTEKEVEAKIWEFIDANPSVSRKLEIVWAGDHPRLKCRGYYRAHRITMFQHQATKPGTGYSWPGHRSDRSLMGVGVHELGHHVHLTRPDVDEISNGVPREKPVSGYEPDLLERFAETFRLFVLNPDLLARARPARFAFLVDYVGLAPIEHRGWREVLGNIPEHQLRRLDTWAPGLRSGTQSVLTL